ncbi:multidrug resistance protein E, partial [Lotmaria passim]
MSEGKTIYGAEAAYTSQAEDHAGWFFGTLFHSWVTDVMHQASKEELTLEGLPRPTRAYRAYNAGTRLSEELQRQQLRRHAWDGYVGARVRVRWDAASDGVLRWVGTVQQYGTPRQLYAGVEWRVAPAQREVGVVGRWLLCRRGEAPESGPGAFHRGDVDGEHLFDLADDDTVATCERVEDVVFCTGEDGDVLENSSGAVDEGPPILSRASVYSGRSSTPAAPKLFSTGAALFQAFRWQLLLLGPLRAVVEGSALLTPLALGWYISLITPHHADSDSGSSSGSTPTPAFFLAAFSSSSASSASFDAGDEAGRGVHTYTALGSVLLLFVLSLIRSLATQKYLQLVTRYACAARSALSACVAEKCLRISQRDLQRPELNVGRIVNFLANDVTSIDNTFYVLWMTVTVPLQVGTALFLLYRSMGWAAGISLVMLAVSVPLLVFLTKLTYRCTVAMSKRTDARLRSMNEMLSGIRAVKFMSLEKTFEKDINARRAAELRSVRRFQFVSIANSLITQSVPSCTTAAVIVAYYFTGQPMSPEVIYPALSLLGLMDTPFELITYLIGVYSQFFVSMRRLTSFLAADDAAARDVLEEVEAAREADSAAAVFAHATISSYKPVPLPTPSWRRDDGEPHFELRVRALLTDVDLRIPRGRLTVVLGPTGSGKSTLLDSLIGALAVTRGRVACSRSVAYVPQQPWIMSATLRDNVVFFGAADAAAFERAVASSQLAADLALLADGAETEIGERGINLSGGQKARVSLARAVYADRDVYVLDDPLSALDAHVGERVMRECVCGALARKTRVLATHQVSAAAYADYVVLLQDGRVAFQGTYAAYRQYARLHYDRSISGLGSTSMYAAHTAGDLGSHEDYCLLEDVLDFVDGNSGASPSTTEADTSVLFTTGEQGSSVSGDVLTEHEQNVAITDSGEEKAVGAVPLVAYLRYMTACGGCAAFLVEIVVFVVTEAVSQSGDVWLSLWSGHKLDFVPSVLRLRIYVVAVLLTMLVAPTRDVFCFTDMRRASYHLHANLLRSIAHAKLVFFDVTPRGRLMNRMSRDMAQIDWDLPVNLDVSFFFFCYLVAYMIIMTVSQPFILVILAPCIFVYSRIFRFFCTANREMQRLLNISNSPVFAVLNEVLTGRWTICTYERQQNMMQEVLRSLDGVFACGYTQCMGARWLAVRVELLGNVAVSSLALLGVVASQSSWMHINLGLLALSVSKASSITAVLSRFITVGASVEASMNCVERVLYYTDNAPAEDVGDDVAAAGVPAAAAGAGPAAGTAHAGSLAFEHVDMRYRPGLPLVLRDVCFAIAPGQKVGVVGRTGSGKSTLLLAFLRLVEVCGGRMLVCGRDARDYGVRELRQLFSMIPQDPLLFDGTVRSNVDPFGACGDAAVWAALRQVGMEERVRGEAGGLDGRVQEGGSNFSVGQRQLLCLARALLKRGSAFLLMDEATANVDPALDRQIQRTVQQTFRDYT